MTFIYAFQLLYCNGLFNLEDSKTAIYCPSKFIPLFTRLLSKHKTSTVITKKNVIRDAFKVHMEGNCPNLSLPPPPI